MASTQGSPAGDLPTEILHALSKQEPILSAEAFPSQKSTDVKSALDRLGSRSMVTFETIEREEAILVKEAQDIALHGSHEARVFEAVRQAVEGLSVADVEKSIGDKNVVKLGQGKARALKWITAGKDGKILPAVGLPRYEGGGAIS